jgi:hypothetical protein
LDYELFFQAQQDFKQTELFAGQFDAQVRLFVSNYIYIQHNKSNGSVRIDCWFFL